MPTMPTTPTKSERPLRRDAERNRERILQAAQEAFAEDGLSVTLDEIAHRAGVGVGTVYRRFPDKEKLIDAIFEDRITAFLAMVEECLAHEDAWAGLLSFFERATEAHAYDRGFKEIAVSGYHGLERCSRARELMLPLVARLVERAQAAGSLRTDVAPTDLPLLQLMLGSLSDCTRDVDPEVWRRYLRIVTDGLRAGCDGPSPLPRDALTAEQAQDATRAWRPAAR